jgi:RNA polymerase sigma-70 factor (ECF subfamily)
VVEETSIGGEARDFPPTRWTRVRSARESPEARRAALEELLAVYWKPLYCYVRRKGRTVEDSKDVVQDFLGRLLERDFLERLDPAKGRLRAFLRASIDHYLINEHEKRAAQKRGGGARTFSLEVEPAERELVDRPEEAGAAFDRAWARGVMERALEALQREFEEGERTGPFALVRRYFGFGEPPPYAEAAREHGMTVVQLKAFLHRARERFRELVRREVAQTVGSASDGESEIAQLLEALRR